MFGEQDHSVGFEKGVGKKAENVGIDKISVMELPESAQTLISWLNKEMPKDLVGKVSYMEEGLSEDKKREFNFMFRQAERDVIELRGLTGAVFFAEQMPLSEEGIYALLERYFWSYTVEHFREIGLFLGHLRGMGMDKEEVRWLMEDMIDCFVAEQLSLIGRVSFMASLEGEEKENVDDKLVYEAVLRALDNRDLIEREFALDRADLIGYLKKGWIYKAMRQRRDFGISAKEDIQRFDFRVITETGVDYLDFKAVYDFLTFFSKEDVESEDYFKTIFNSGKLQKLLDEQGKEADSEGMHYFIKCMELVGEAVPENIKSDIEKHWGDELAERERVDKKREMYGDINLSYELVRFYVLQYLNLAILSKKSELERFDWEGGELKIRDAVFMRDKEQYFNKQIEQAFDWVSKYLVVAVNSELKNQYYLSRGSFEVALPIEFENVEEFIKGATPDQIKNYLKKAVTHFGKRNWKMLHMFGGKPWAKIAEVALKAWGENTVDQKALLLDTAFHLQHNNGFVFDKDRKIHFSPETEQERRILDAKFKARDLGELINFIKTEITNEELLKEIDQLVSTINRVNELKPVKKGGGY